MTERDNANLYAVYRRHFSALSECLLTTADGRSYTYGDAERYSAQVANFLRGLGLAAGERVSVQVEKSPQYLWLYLGSLRAGMVFHPLNPAYTDEELRYFLGDAEPSLLICDSAREEALQVLCTQLAVPHLRTLDADGTGTLMREVAEAARQFNTVPRQPGDMAALLYSSGTTGRPKGIVLTHRNLASNAAVVTDFWGFSRRDCLLHALPVFHVHGLFVAIGCVLMSGASMRWLPRFDAARVLENLPQCTVMMGVPTYYTRLLAEPDFDARRCAGVRLFISGSAPLLIETFRTFERRTGKAILERYGMTETGMNTSNPLRGQRRAGTVGLPLPGVSLRVCDARQRPVAPGEVGDIQVKGDNVFAGYWRLPDKTRQDFTADGFFITGDKGELDEDGYVTIVGRSRDMVISGGLNVYPREIELLLDQLPGVLESAVIGLPDPDLGEVVAAVVVPERVPERVPEGEGALSSAAIRAALRAQLAGFKVPRKVFFADHLPRNAMGKVQKNLLREKYVS